MNRTGVRTFEAAAFLRRCGADITRVRKMFRDDMESYRAKAEAMREAEVYKNQLRSQSARAILKVRRFLRRRPQTSFLISVGSTRRLY